MGRRSALAVPRFAIDRQQAHGGGGPGERLIVDSDPSLFLTRISVNIHVRSHEAADPTLGAALQMFRRAANVVARLEDALIFFGRRNGPPLPPPAGAPPAPTGLPPPLAAPTTLLNALPAILAGIPAIYETTNDRHNVPGIFTRDPLDPRLAQDQNWWRPQRLPIPPQCRADQQRLLRGGQLGENVANAIVAAIDLIESRGYFGPFACALGHSLFEAVCSPSPSLVLPRDRILPFLQGPLLRASSIDPEFGVVIALGAAPVEIVVATDLHATFLQRAQDSSFVFRVSERVALRIKDGAAIQHIRR